MIAGIQAALGVGSVDPAVVTIEARRAAERTVAVVGAHWRGPQPVRPTGATTTRYDDLLEAR